MGFMIIWGAVLVFEFFGDGFFCIWFFNVFDCLEFIGGIGYFNYCSGMVIYVCSLGFDWEFGEWIFIVLIFGFLNVQFEWDVGYWIGYLFMEFI